jgi:xanthine dehydrogenase accessory factor
LNTRTLLDRFSAWRAKGRPLVLATVTETIGSTYSKAGHRILIDDEGRYQGLVSGGCLEGDLALHARDVLADGRPRIITYDLRGEAEEVFGLGVGCNGLLRVLLQRLEAATEYQPFQAMADVLEGTEPGIAVVITDAPDDTIATPGATLLVAGGESRSFGLTPGGVTELESLARAEAPLPRQAALAAGGHALVAALAPVPRLLVLGAGLDVPPLVNMAATSGFRVTVCDHRPAYLERGDLGAAERTLLVRPEALGDTLPLDQFAAVVVMSHHLASDRHYLARLAGTAIPYVALLGPRTRRERLLKDLGAAALLLRPRLRGPAGLDIGADSPATIALSLLAEIVAVSHGRTGGSLDQES